MPSKATLTWDPQRLKRDRLHMLQEEMKLRDIGALYLTDQNHIRYALNEHVPGAEVFVPAEGEALGLIRQRDMGYVTRSHATVRLRFYDRAAARTGTFSSRASSLSPREIWLISAVRVSERPEACSSCR